ncbi:YgfZ/GcvT domain-containing protein [Thiofilum flexile]|uniref:CAF17-like 4Fe-4S cluster assembly/insertion protein YgfZ n=1 Tax=Thiofilum flexile TaxID=125627 RepID=UPI00037377A1|nr:folate-binding protein YgfZ [Thiofilum flexile]
MKASWRQFLTHQGAEFEAGKLISFGNPERERSIPPQGAILCDLSHQGLIAVNGKDARSFLQGQLSADVDTVSPTHTVPAAYCTPKGRALATFQVLEREGTLYLATAADLVEPMLKRLRMFVMRSDVALTDAHDSFVHFGYADPQGEQRLQAILGRYPAKVDQVLQINQLTIIRRPAEVPRFEIYGQLTESQQLWEALSVNAAAVTTEVWNYFEIAAGIPHVTLESSDAWVPQMLNLQLLNGISFTKGCYPGQEIVARLKYLGKNKRQLYRLGVDSFHTPAVGAVISSPTEPDAGQVLNAALNPDSKVEVLAIMKIAYITEALTLEGQTVQVLPLPYETDTE